MVTNLTEGKPSKVLFFFTLPMLLGNIFQQLYNLADSLIVGRVVGPDGLAAVGGSFAISFLAIGIATGASQGCSIIISQCFGAKDYNKMKTGFTTALIAVTSMGLLIMIASFFFLKPLLTLLKTPNDIFADTLSYVRIVFIGCIFLFAYNCLTAIFNALGDSKTPLKFLIASTILNIILDIIFVAFMNMGVNGAAIATLIAQILSAVGLFLYFMKKLKTLPGEKSTTLFDTVILKNMLRIAIPSIIQQSMVSIGMMAVQGLVNSFGKEMVAGYTAATKIDSIAVMPMINIGIALSSYTAQNLGADKPERVKKGYHASVRLVLIFAVIISALIYIFGRYFVAAFIDSNVGSTAISYGLEYLQIVSVFYVIMGFMFITGGVLRGAGDMKIFMLSTLVNIISRIAFAYIFVPIIGHTAIFWSLPVGWLLAGTISFTRYISGKWKRKSISI